jgi:hypothetical protein
VAKLNREAKLRLRREEKAARKAARKLAAAGDSEGRHGDSAGARRSGA